MAQYDFLIHCFVAGILASLACGLGALPLLFPQFDVQRHMGLGYGLAGGLMFSASVYNLLLPGLTLDEHVPGLRQVVLVLFGLLVGASFLSGMDRFLTRDRLENSLLGRLGNRRELLIFLAMSFHSIPEGVAVGVGYASAQYLPAAEGLGDYIALAIGIHNIPEGLAVAIPLRAGGASIFKCFVAAFLTSLPQPIAAVPAALLVWLFEPLMIPLLGVAAGAMIFLVVRELIPDALETRSPTQTAWAFIAGFSFMILIQAAL
ncbi:MAG: ZIP family metal transporter [Candidatus Latescibacteria bacterium]|jgi:zinc transporter, ZIP family|nr:ZIP family metal transporter [Candidatus Latescibacterota bacterium]MBT5832426.1 ZIP family metal transporter [Candidatus Latescibacterota bacterium]